MVGHIRKNLSYGFLIGRVVCLAGLIAASGCSKGTLEKGQDFAKTWACDRQADEAMKRHDYDAAIFFHERLLEEEPDNGLAMYHLGYAYGQRGDHAKEVFYYEKAIGAGFRHEGIYFNLGMAYGELNRIQDAIRAFKESLNTNPNSAESRFGLAIAYNFIAVPLAVGGKRVFEGH